MVTRRCALCGHIKSIKRFYFGRRSRKYQHVCRSCRNSGALSVHTHAWRMVSVTTHQDQWRWKYRCHVCAETRVFRTSYPPYSWKPEKSVPQPTPETLGPLAGQKIVVTGALSMLRDEAVGKLEALGGSVSTRVTTRTTMLLVGRRASQSKVDRAIAAGAKILREPDLKRLVEKSKIWESNRVKLFKQIEPEAALKQWARQVLNYSVRIGVTRKPDACQDCGCNLPLDGHHDDYQEPLLVRWLCRKCHPKADRARRSKEPPRKDRRLRAYRALLKEEQQKGMIRRVPDSLLIFS